MRMFHRLGPSSLIVPSFLWAFGRNRAVLISSTKMMSLQSSSSSSTKVNEDNDEITSIPSSCKKSLIAVAQLCSTSNKRLNLLQIAKCTGWAVSCQAQMIFLPEACGFLGSNSKQVYDNAEPPLSQEAIITTTSSSTLDDEEKDSTMTPKNPSWLVGKLQETVHNYALQEKNQFIKNDTNEKDYGDHNPQKEDDEDTFSISILDGLQTIARAGNMWMSVGGLHIRVQGDDDNDNKNDQNNNGEQQQQKRVYNSHLLLDPRGRIRSIYHKIHLFDVSIPGKVELKESNSTASGDRTVLCDTPVGRMGLTTCYDVRFPELYLKLLEQGAQILPIPSAFTVPTGTAHWHVLLRARAIESQCYVIAAAQYGQHNEKRSTYGHSLVVDPWGNVIADAGGCDSSNKTDDGVVVNPPGIITAEIDLAQLSSIRERMPIQKHRMVAKY